MAQAFGDTSAGMTSLGAASAARLSQDYDRG